MKKTLQVEGMSCGHCVATVKDAMDELEVNAKISLEERTVSVDDDEQKISLQQIKETIEDNGYEVKE